VAAALAAACAAWVGGALTTSRHRRAKPELIPPAAIATFQHSGPMLSGPLDMDALARAVTDAGVAMTGAALGAFVYTDDAGRPARYVTGAPAGTFGDLSLPQDPAGLRSPFRGAVVRSDDLGSDSRFDVDLPSLHLPTGQTLARSSLAAAVHSSVGVFRGTLFFGHPATGHFDDADERLVADLAAHAAIAVDNVHLYREAQAAREAAEAANRTKDAFLATLSHELRTPLTAIMGWANLLKLGRLEADETSRALDTILRNATAQGQIIDELLDVSRIITGKLRLDLQVVDVGAIVRGAVETVTPAAQAKGIRTQLIQDPAGSWVMGDPERLQQVFWNLLFNAVKFTPRNGRVRVTVQSIGSSVEVVVNDTGLGIEPALLTRIFDRFTQADSSSTRAARGLGLGLSIARQLAELHGGTLNAESAGLGCGSTFTATFPRSAVTSEPASDPQAAVGLDDAPRLDGLRLLVVDDDDDARRLIERILTGQGASVRSVATAQGALALLGSESVDVLVSDIEMPATDGYQLVRELRGRSAGQGGAVPALALSAYARTEDRLRALRAGFQLHLAKPVQPSELVTVVASLAARLG
jgi:signal transduction histidine kinase/CheY-like chemotaxis protein